jgi:hypothetical protein
VWAADADVVVRLARRELLDGVREVSTRHGDRLEARTGVPLPRDVVEVEQSDGSGCG